MDVHRLVYVKYLNTYKNILEKKTFIKIAVPIDAHIYSLFVCASNNLNSETTHYIISSMVINLRKQTSMHTFNLCLSIQEYYCVEYKVKTHLRSQYIIFSQYFECYKYI